MLNVIKKQKKQGFWVCENPNCILPPRGITETQMLQMTGIQTPGGGEAQRSHSVRQQKMLHEFPE